MRRQDTVAAYILIEIGEVETEFKVVCDYLAGMPATWYEPADGPEINVTSIERIKPDPNCPGCFKGTGDFMPRWVCIMIEEDFATRGYVYDKVMDALIDADGH